MSRSGYYPHDGGRRAYDAVRGGESVPSDRQVHALVAPGGNVEWLCLPRPDSSSVFGAMLDRSAGHFRLGPAEVTVPAGRRYVPGTLVLETTWQTRTGRA